MAIPITSKFSMTLVHCSGKIIIRQRRGLNVYSWRGTKSLLNPLRAFLKQKASTSSTVFVQFYKVILHSPTNSKKEKINITQKKNTPSLRLDVNGHLK